MIYKDKTSGTNYGIERALFRSGGTNYEVDMVFRSSGTNYKVHSNKEYKTGTILNSSAGSASRTSMLLVTPVLASAIEPVTLVFSANISTPSYPDHNRTFYMKVSYDAAGDGNYITLDTKSYTIGPGQTKTMYKTWTMDGETSVKRIKYYLWHNNEALSIGGYGKVTAWYE